MVKILMVTSYLIVPPTSGGAQRMIKPLMHLTDDDDISVDILFAAEEDKAAKAKEYLSVYPGIDWMKGVSASIDISSEIGKPEGFPQDVWSTMSQELKDAAVSRLKEVHYDIIQLEHSQMAWLAPVLKMNSPESKLVLDLHNAEYRVYEGWKECARPEDLAEVTNKYEGLYNWEKTAWKWFDAVLTVSPVETELVKQCTGLETVYEVPTGGGIDPAEYTPTDKNREKPYDLLYLGTMEWFPNAHGMLWFMNNVFPEVQKLRPGTKLHIVGFGKPDGELVQKAQKDPNTKFWGQQEDDKKFFWGAKVFLVPLFLGAGARVKVPTAWTAQVPIASTLFGPEGLDARNGENICMTDNPKEYAQNIVRLLDDPKFAAKIIDNAYRTATEKYSSEICLKMLVEVYHALAEKSC